MVCLMGCEAERTQNTKCRCSPSLARFIKSHRPSERVGALEGICTNRDIPGPSEHHAIYHSTCCHPDGTSRSEETVPLPFPLLGPWHSNSAWHLISTQRILRVLIGTNEETLKAVQRLPLTHNFFSGKSELESCSRHVDEAVCFQRCLLVLPAIPALAGERL